MDKKIKEGPVRIIVPTSVGYDIKRFKECLSVVGRRLGCPTCFSGRPDCQFILAAPALMIDDKLAVHDVVHPDHPAGNGSPTISVGLPKTVSNNLELINQVVDQVVGRIGCLPCTSGFDLIFQQELNSMSFQVSEQGKIA